MSEIARSKMQNVESIHRGNGVEVFKSLRRFDLKDDKTLLIAVTNILVEWQLAELCVRVASVDRTLSERMEAHPGHNLPRLLGGRHMRNHNAGGVRFQRLDEIAVASLRNAND